MEYSFRHSMCNEAFEKRPFADTGKAIRRAGYRGIDGDLFQVTVDDKLAQGCVARWCHL